jgi:hypothetical protein
MILDKLDKLSAREKTGVVLSVVCVLIVGADRLVVQPMIGRYNQLREQIEIKEKDLQLSRTILGSKQQVESSYRQVEELLDAPASEAEAIAGMKKQMDSLADRMGVTIKSRDHLEPQNRKFFDEYALDLKEFEANRRNFLTFVHSLAYMRRASGMLQIASLRVTPQKRREKLEGSMVITKVMLPPPAVRQ